MLSFKVVQTLSSGLRPSNCGHLDTALHRFLRMRLPSHLRRSVRFLSATHTSRSAVLAVSGRVTTDPEDLRCHTSHRWLFDEEKQLAARYVPLDHEALERVASESVGSRCVRINKVAEDDFNRTFLLSFENGKEAFARFPYPILGPTDLVAASEAATTHFVGHTLTLPIPKLLAYSSRRRDDTSVGAAYVLTEKPPGVPFGAVSNHTQATKQERAIENLQSLLDGCAIAFRFSQAGSLYFAKDVEDLPHTTEVFSGPTKLQFSGQASLYTIGPSVDWELWRGARQHLDLDRGPWETPLSIIEGMVHSQQTWLKTIPERRPQDAAYFNEEDASPSAHIAALDDLLACIPHILPPSPRLSFPTLGPHYQLGRYASIDPSECPVVTLTDWQRALILPFFMQDQRPPAWDAPPFRVPDGGPRDHARRQTQADLRMTGELVKVLKAGPDDTYGATESLRWLLYWRMRHEGERSVGVLSSLPLRTWQHSVYLLRARLVDLQCNWSHFVTDDAPCPLDFSDEECGRMLDEAWRFTRRAATTSLLGMMVGANPDGRVRTERYAEARMLCDEIAGGWCAEDHGPFPFQDGGRSAMTS